MKSRSAIKMEINNNQKKDKELNRVLFQNVNRKEKKTTN